jgi:hypothetical protein
MLLHAHTHNIHKKLGWAYFAAGCSKDPFDRPSGVAAQFEAGLVSGF